VNLKDVGNRNFWGRALSVGGWVLHVRVRRKESRPVNRRWLKVDLYNYNYSEEARERSRDLTLTTCPDCGELVQRERGGEKEEVHP